MIAWRQVAPGARFKVKNRLSEGDGELARDDEHCVAI